MFSKLAFVDVETTGLSVSDSSIIEIGVVYLDDRFQPIGTWESLIKPDRGEITPEISALTGIIPDDVAQSPGAEVIADQLKGVDVLVAHNADFDRQFIDPILGSDNGHEWVCTYNLALHLWPDAPAHKLQVLRYWQGILEWGGYSRKSLSEAHRALPDCLVGAALLQRLAARVGGNVDRLIAGTKQIALLPRIPFGDLRGQPFCEADVGLLEWIIRKRADDHRLVETAKHWLAKKKQGE